MAKKADTNPYAADAGKGTENISQENTAMPVLTILQRGSPQIDKTHRDHAEKKIEGAEPGDIVLNSTNEIVCKVESTFEMIPIKSTSAVSEWRPKRGGMVQIHPNENILSQGVEQQVDGKTKRLLPNGNELVRTIYFYILWRSDEESGWREGVIALTSTQYKKGRKLNTLLFNTMIPDPDTGKPTGQQMPTFAQVFNVSAVPESNDEGSWFGWHFERQPEFLLPDDEAYQQGRNTYEKAQTALEFSGPQKQIENDTGSEGDKPY